MLYITKIPRVPYPQWATCTGKTNNSNHAPQSNRNKTHKSAKHFVVILYLTPEKRQKNAHPQHPSPTPGSPIEICTCAAGDGCQSIARWARLHYPLAIALGEMHNYLYNKLMLKIFFHYLLV